MPSADVIDHSPHFPEPAARLPNATNLVLIDNYDSFTWNVYQYLELEGANVTVFRNDEISLAELIQLNPTQLVISPGPGHPDTDSGISRDAIKYFAGKIPVLGVCMGEQCIFKVFGGHVDVTGEIFHGKTSALKHDGKGVYDGISQNLPVTRYHSLAGTHSTLPDCLEVSSWIRTEWDGGRDVIMGVRHKELLVEGVQFHPESILTAEGRPMLSNFLKMRGGTWAENREHSKATIPRTHMVNNGIPENPFAGKQANGSSKDDFAKDAQELGKAQESILEKIYRHRRTAIDAQKTIPSLRPTDLQATYNMNLAPAQISFPDRLKRGPYQLSLMAEIKRASPSKGIIALDTCAPDQARKYALSGASVISVLTEPEWFKGSMADLRFVRQSLDGMRDRPAVLCKEFVFDEYQILEARLAGADTVLLIVKMLDEDLLKRLYQYSHSLGMEPLVEVNTEAEMQIALSLGSKVIGVNNRNLTNFEVDLETTSRLMSGVPSGTIVCALSGISGSKDVKPYQKCGIGAVLVGEALMRAADTAVFVRELLGGGSFATATPSRKRRNKLLVKICGTRTPEAAKVAVEAGADLIGMILVKGRGRCVTEDIALAISETVRTTRKPTQNSQDGLELPNIAVDFFRHASSRFLATKHRSLLVGVFLDQPLDYILEQQKLLDLDIVQLHGSEPLEWARLIPVPVIRKFSPTDLSIGKRGLHAAALLDAGAGGSGQSLDTEMLRSALSQDEQLQVFLAGGLDPQNVRTKVEDLGELSNQIVGVDVSSGVEVDGKQNVEKIIAFIKAAKEIVGT